MIKIKKSILLPVFLLLLPVLTPVVLIMTDTESQSVESCDVEKICDNRPTQVNPDGDIIKPDECT